MSKIIDVDNDYIDLKLIDFLEKDSLIRLFSENIAETTSMPVNTVLITGMTVFSSMACRKWCIEYKYGGRLPIGLYAAIEQPSATSKSRVLELFQQPFFNIHRSIVEKAKQNLKQAELIKDKPAIEACKETMKYIHGSLFLTNATPESLDSILNLTNGFFSALSSEQALFDTLIGGLYSDKGKKSNNDAILQGFNGGYISSSRVTRNPYSGFVIGAVLGFAQKGTIAAILNNSEQSGLAERFIFCNEKHSLGTRDHSSAIPISKELLERYSDACEFMRSIFEAPMELKDMISLRLTNNGYEKIITFRDSIEPNLADGMPYSFANLRGMAGKADIFIMKIASILYLLSEDYRTKKVYLIPDRFVSVSIKIVHRLLRVAYECSSNNGAMGDKSEFDSILDLFEKDQRQRSERNIIKSKVKTKPFVHYSGNKSAYVREALKKMVDCNILIEFESNDIKPIKFYILSGK